MRNHIEGQEKILAESGSARGFKPVGYSKGNSIYSDGEHPFTYDGQPIQVLDIVDSNTDIATLPLHAVTIDIQAAIQQ